MNLAKTGAAFGLAALTLASSLSLGAAANAAPANQSRASANLGQLIFESGDDDSYYFVSGSIHSNSWATDYSDRTESLDVAKAKAAIFNFGTSGRAGEVTLAGDSYKCLTTQKISNTGGHAFLSFAIATCNGSEAQKWKLTETGVLESASGGHAVGWEMLVNSKGVGGLKIDSGDALTPAEGSVETLRGLTVQVDKVYPKQGKADISGRGEAGATVVVGDSEFPVDGDGNWRGTAINLSDTVNDLMVEQWKDGEKISERPLSIDLSVTAVNNLVAAFDTDYSLTDATVSGTGQPGAEVIVKDNSGHASKGSADSVSGEFSIRVPAPGVGKQTFSVTQNQGSTPSPARTVDLTYGASVNVTTPTDDSDLDGDDSVVFRGNGAKQGDKVWILENDNIVGTEKTAIANGTWSLEVSDVTDAEHTYTVKQLSRGGLTTTQVITVNPGKTLELADAKVDTTSVTAGISNHFTGTATPGATLRIVNSSGTAIVPGTINVDLDGKWEFDRVVSNGAANLTFKIEQTKGSMTAVSDVFVIKAVQSLIGATVITQTITPGVENTFTGTATKGATLKIVNVSGTQIVPGDIAVNATTGAWVFKRVISLGAPDFKFKIIQSKGGANLTSGLFTIQSGSSIVAPTISTATVTAGIENTFRGTATPGAVIRVLNISGTQIVPGTVTADAKTGAFSFKRVVSTGATNFRFAIEQTKEGETAVSTLFTLNAK